MSAQPNVPLQTNMPNVPANVQCPNSTPICYDKNISINDSLKNVEMMRNKTVGDSDCPQTQEKFCAKFDYVWITNIKTALERIVEFISKSDADPTLIPNILNDFADIQQQGQPLPPTFDIMTFIKDIVILAQAKWGNNPNPNNQLVMAKFEELNKVSNFLKPQLEGQGQGQANVDMRNFGNNAQMIKDGIEEIKALFDVALYIGLYEGNDLGEVDQKRIIELLNTFGKIAAQPASGGRKSRKRKSKSKKGKKGKKTRRRYRMRGGDTWASWFTDGIYIVLFFVAIALVIPTVGYSWKWFAK